MSDFAFSAQGPESPCSTGTLSLKGRVTIESSGALRDALIDALGKTQGLVVDVSQVTAIDLCGLQLLCAAHKSAIRDYKCLSLGSRRSTAFTEKLREAGYHCMLPGTCMGDDGQSCLWLDPVEAWDWEVL